MDKILWKEYSESIGDLWLKHEYSGQPVVAVGVIILDCGRLVLVKRSDEPALGKWIFPRGSSRVKGRQFEMLQ